MAEDEQACSVEKMFFGSVTVGERGQVVIPSEARRLYQIETGDRLLVFGHPEKGGVALIKVTAVERFVEFLRDMLLHETVSGAAPPSGSPTNGDESSNAPSMNREGD